MDELGVKNTVPEKLVGISATILGFAVGLHVST